METYDCRSCGEEYEIEDLYQGMCDACYDEQEINYLRSH